MRISPPAGQNAPGAYGIQKAVDYIKERLAKQVWHNGERLPTISVLARSSDVSRMTMWKAVEILKKKGVVSGRKGGRIYAGNGSMFPKAISSLESGSPWKAKRVLVEQDLLNGIFAPGKVLPTMGELQARYGVCYKTMRKILNALMADRVLIPDKKGFLVPGIGKRKAQTSVCLLWEGINLDGMRNRPFRERKIIESLESEYSRSGIDLVLFGYDSGDPAVAGRLQAVLEERGMIIGFIVRPLVYGDPRGLAKQAGLLHTLAMYKKPIAVLDELGLFELPRSLAANRFIRIFKIAGLSAGQSVGRMLLSLGHRRVAFVSHYQRDAWSILRYQGLVNEYAKAGLENGVTPYTMESLNDEMRNILVLSGEFAPANLSPLARKIVDSKHDEIQRLRANVKALASLSGANMNGPTLRFILEHGLDPLQGELACLLLEPIFEKAAADRSCTAWVSANDDCAVYALDYLRSNGKRVPEEISVAGFDNDPLGFENGVTSFDFDFPNIVRHMMLFIARPLWGTRYAKSSSMEMPGSIIKRATTGARR
jgi:DNA-binding transcriptional regulator YhcF (GntR family)